MVEDLRVREPDTKIDIFINILYKQSLSSPTSFFSPPLPPPHPLSLFLLFSFSTIEGAYLTRSTREEDFRATRIDPEGATRERNGLRGLLASALRIAHATTRQCGVGSYPIDSAPV